MLFNLLAIHVFNPLDPYLIEVGNFQWAMYSVMIMLGLVIAILLGIREGNNLGITTNDIIDGVIVVVPLSIIGTRLWYVAFEWGQFKGDLLKIFAINEGGLAIHGGFITALISVYFFTKFKKINLFSAFDIVVPGFLIAQAFGRWGNFFNQEAHGGLIGGVPDGFVKTTADKFTYAQDSITNTSFWDTQRAFLESKLHLPDFITNQMFLEGPNGLGYYHPTFLYESLWNILGFIIILILRRTKLVRRGEFLAFYLVWYSAGRFFIEGMRTDSLYIGNTGLRTAQIISLIMIVGGIIFFAFNRLKLKTKFYHEVLEETAALNEIAKFEEEAKKAELNQVNDDSSNNDTKT
jgi:phosphatidylglycerol:prolipoprotein diacylglycerol transferase